MPNPWDRQRDENGELEPYTVDEAREFYDAERS
jgi:hypothetical protein